MGDLKDSFVHLHNHSEYSILDGMSSIAQIVASAVKFEQPAIAITDHGNLYAAVEFYLAAKDAGIKPLIGMEGYMAHGKMDDRGDEERSPYHLTLLAQNNAGYLNLLKLSSLAHLKGFHYRARFDWDLLRKYGDGLIVLSGCLGGELQTHLARDDVDKARATAKRFKDEFGDRYYFELMRHEGVKALGEINPKMVELGRELEIPLVATNDSHYTEKVNAKAHDTLLCIQTNARENDGDDGVGGVGNKKKRFKFDGETYYLRSSAEMRQIWSDLPEAVDNSLAIAERIDVLDLIPTEPLFPKFQTPNGESALEYLTHLCNKGLELRYGGRYSEAVNKRMEYELHVISETGFAHYFLVCWDIFKFVNSQKMLSAVRGSAAASLVLYLLEVTTIDPLEYDLVFERFLNLERREMPDIDMDFQDDRRNEVINYCTRKYGTDHVAQIVTFSKLGARAALRDTARVMGLNSQMSDNLAKTVPERLHVTLEATLKESQEMQALIAGDATCKKVVERARQLEGIVRHVSTHAAGIVIAGKPLLDVVPLQTAMSGGDEAPPMTQFAMDAVAKIGLLKMDFLGLRNLTVLDMTTNLLRERKDGNFELHSVVLNDEKTFKMLSEGNTYGVFQLESDGMKRYILELKPTSVDDVAAMIALYRPGPMEQIGNFIGAKHGKRDAHYLHDDLREILGDTYGVIVFQDQILLIAQKFGGYTLGQADILRKAMGKKKPEVMKRERARFIEGALANGYEKGLAEQLFALIEPFAGYAFNKAHSVSYAMISYWTAYMKANHPLEYLTALLKSFSHDKLKTAECINEASKLNIRVIAPDVNRMEANFSITQMEDGRDGIMFGMRNIKGVGANPAKKLLEEREKGGSFKSLEDFCDRVDSSYLTSSVLHGLILSGSLDAFGERQSLQVREQNIVTRIKVSSAYRRTGQSSMKDLFGEEVEMPRPTLAANGDEVPVEPADKMTLLQWESQTLGIAVSRDLLGQPAKLAQQVNLLDIKKAPVNEEFEVSGVITGKRQQRTRGGEVFLNCTLQMLDGEISIVVWPDVLKQSEGIWEVGKQATILGRVHEWNGEKRLRVVRADGMVTPATDESGNGVDESPHSSNGVEQQPAQSQDKFLITVDESDLVDTVSLADEMLKTLLNYHGDRRVVVEVKNGERTVSLELPSDFNVAADDDLDKQLDELIATHKRITS